MNVPKFSYPLPASPFAGGGAFAAFFMAVVSSPEFCETVTVPSPDKGRVRVGLLNVNTLTNNEVRQDAGKISAEIARAHALTEFEKYRVVQDRLFESDFDKVIRLNNHVERGAE